MASVSSILVIEDDPIHSLMIRKMFDKINIQAVVLYATDGREGLDLIFRRGKYRDRRSYPVPGLILLDIRMPRVDGFEVLAALRSNSSTKRIPVIMLTTSESAEDKTRCQKLGANAYIVKPVSSAQLREKLRDLNLPWRAASGQSGQTK